MRKKFLSALLLGLFTVGMTSTVVSCKDYDDDISSLQNKISSLSDAVNQKEQTINQSISSLQSAIDKANNDHATKAALETAKQALEKAIKDNYDTQLAKNSAFDAAIAKAQGAADAANNLAKENKEAIAGILTTLSSVNSTLGTLSTGLSEANTKIGKLEAAVEAQQKAGGINDQIKAEVKTVADNLKAAEKALGDKITEEVGKVSSALSETNATLDQVKATAQANAADLKTLKEVTLPGIDEKIAKLKADCEVLALALAEDLRSLVFIPNLYVDGIETIEYPFLKDTTLVAENVDQFTRKRTTGAVDTYGKTIQGAANVMPGHTPLQDYLYKANDSKEWIYGPTMAVDYHMNPGSSNTAYADVKGWNCREVEVVTRAAASAFGAITSPEKFDDGTQLFKNSKGILTVGLKIANPKPLLGNGPAKVSEGATGNKSYGKDNIVSLKVNTKNDKKDSIVTSDYAMLFPEVIHPEGIVYVKDNNRVYANNADVNKDGDEIVSHSFAKQPELNCPVVDTDNKKYGHVFDTPVEALNHTQGTKKAAGDNAIAADSHGTPDFLLPFYSQDGITLSEYIGTHIQKVCDIKGHSVKLQTLAFNEVKKYGLKYIFELVDYTVDGNKTIESHYATIDKYTGKIVACDVDDKGMPVAGKQNESTIGREPLVRVRLVDQDTESKTFLDGYILLRISPKSIEQTTALITEYAKPVKAEFDLCNAITLQSTTWAEFDEYVLTSSIWGDTKMTLEAFDSQYALDLVSDTKYGTIGGGQYLVKLFKATTKDGKTVYEPYTYKDVQNHVTQLGSMIVNKEKQNLSNDAFIWTITEDEAEHLTHEKTVGSETDFVQYIRYKSVSPASKYDYIYVKFAAKISRKAADKTGIATKNLNYWFDLNGADCNPENANYSATAKFDAVAMNIASPAENGGTDCTPKTWSNALRRHFTTVGTMGNEVDFTNSKYQTEAYRNGDATDVIKYRKFYFAPINTTVKESCTEKGGRTWTITAKKSKTDEEWNAFVCDYNICCSDASHKSTDNLGVYRPDYTADCNTNLHGNAKYTTHKFQTKQGSYGLVSDDEKNSKILQECAISYDEGCFTNKALYATCDNVNYTKIAELNQATGEITLVAAQAVVDLPLDLILNAIGYDEKHANISTEFRTWVGIVTNNGCGNAVDHFTTYGDLNKNYSLFLTSWQRPINLDPTKVTEVEDAEENGEYISIYDLLSFYDWRGPVKGCMENKSNGQKCEVSENGDAKWLWAYYNIKKVEFDLDPAKVMTNMHQADKNNFVKLSSVNTMAHLFVGTSYDPETKSGTHVSTTKHTMDNINYTGYYKLSQSKALEEHFQTKEMKDKFGYIYYENNGENVTDFTIKVPVKVIYQWGHFDTYVVVNIKRTQGN